MHRGFRRLKCSMPQGGSPDSDSMPAFETSAPCMQWSGRRVFVTGHTGFKGGWLSLWLAGQGALIHGYAIEPPSTPSFFGACGLANRIAQDTRADIRDGAALSSAIRDAQPEVVFHLAAQPLVRSAYEQPLSTLDVNVMGTARLLEAILSVETVRAVVVVTTDKCYENREWDWPYRESDALGGFDPYSSSKACAELVTASYRRSFLEARGIGVATARAGNVIGGGDWATDRLVPDFFRAIEAGQSLAIRSPGAVRPWQHVLEPLAGYIMLAERLLTHSDAAESWNFGPEEADAHTVGWMADRLCTQIPGARWDHVRGNQPHEAQRLSLDSSKARRRLGWRPRWNLEQALSRTVAWHLAWRDGADMGAVTETQIAAYEAAAPAADTPETPGDVMARTAA